MELISHLRQSSAQERLGQILERDSWVFADHHAHGPCHFLFFFFGFLAAFLGYDLPLATGRAVAVAPVPIVTSG